MNSVSLYPIELTWITAGRDTGIKVNDPFSLLVMAFFDFRSIIAAKGTGSPVSAAFMNPFNGDCDQETRPGKVKMKRAEYFRKYNLTIIKSRLRMIIQINENSGKKCENVKM